MPSAAYALKEIRAKARPKLSIRRVAELLDMSASSYGFYENPNLYKKPYLPIDFTRKIASLFTEYGIDPSEVMKLAGLTTDEAKPEAKAIEASQPSIHFFTAQVALPNEAALAAMFETLLAIIPEDATRVEAARILAQRLPTGFAAIGPAVFEE